MEPLVEQAVNHYHDALSPQADAAWEQLQALFTEHHLRFRDRFVCSVMRPVFMTTSRFQTIRHASEAFLSALGLIHDALMEDSELRARIGVTPDEWEVIRLDPGYRSPDGFTRLDGFLDADGRLQFIEFNAESPGGLAFADALSDAFEQLPAFQTLRKHTPIKRFQTRRTLLDTLLSHYRAWGGLAVPTVAIVDWASGVGTAAEFLLCQQRFQAAGVPTIITTPEALELRRGALWDSASGQRVDLVYKRVVTGELLERIGPNNILAQAVRERAACMVNSFRGQLLFKKAIFAVMSEWVAEGRLSGRMGEALRNHLPWTRIASEGTTTGPSGEGIDLMAYAREAREELVLKPNAEYGGKGVVLGWESEGAVWEAALTEALAAPQPFVLQRRVPVSVEPFPLITPDGDFRIEPRLLDIDPYCHQGHFIDGAGVRLGTTGILNVTAGGGSAVPLFLIEG